MEELGTAFKVLVRVELAVSATWICEGEEEREVRVSDQKLVDRGKNYRKQEQTLVLTFVIGCEGS